MTQFDTTATIISYTAYEAGRAGSTQAPIINYSGGEIIDEAGRPVCFDTSDAFFEDAAETFEARGDAVCAALMSLRDALIDDGASSAFDDDPSRPSQTLDIAMIAAHGRSETFLVMRLRRARSPL